MTPFLPSNCHQIIADAVQLAYKGAPTDVQQKIRRVVEVWRSRSVFEVPIVDAIEGRLDGNVYDHDCLLL